MIQQRMSAGGIVIIDNKVLLVHHYRKDEYDFWVLPGGGIEENEGIFRAAEREVLEETNLKVNAQKLVYIEEFMDEGKYVCKFWVLCNLDQGTLSIEHKDANETYLDDARFFSEEDLKGVNVFPEILKKDFWQDLSHNFPVIKYLGYQ
ncbi:MAG: NUDIX hydrolase [Anaerolineaceae bacterium]|nr:NUDIX hydrolase [Anaerolineaceae bacterium]